MNLSSKDSLQEMLVEALLIMNTQKIINNKVMTNGLHDLVLINNNIEYVNEYVCLTNY